MNEPVATTPIAEFQRPAAVLRAGMGVAFLAAALGGGSFAAVEMRNPELQSIVLLALGVFGALALAAGLLNSWRVPMLAIHPDRLAVPTFLGRREIALRPGHPVGELLATPANGGDRPGDIEANKFVHFFTLDQSGRLTELAALHRASPQIEAIRRAFAEVAGIRVEVLTRDPTARRPRPMVAHWQTRAS